MKYIAFLDILGFKDMVMNNNHIDLVRKFRELFSLNIQMSLSNKNPKIISHNGIDTAIPDLEGCNINSLNVSDSVILWTDDDSMKNFLNLIISVWKIFSNSFSFGFPMRGSIVIGEMTLIRGEAFSSGIISQQSLIGKGLIDAYLLEGVQEWSGCIIHEDSIKKFNDYYHQYKLEGIKDVINSEYLVEKRIITKYFVPQKNDLIKEEFVINWTSFNPNIITESLIRKSFSDHRKNSSNKNIEIKIQNTIDFYTHLVGRSLPKETAP